MLKYCKISDDFYVNTSQTEKFLLCKINILTEIR
nr:MAG TPA: hypothetical protein [Caudoviricetes sp.]